MQSEPTAPAGPRHRPSSTYSLRPTAFTLFFALIATAACGETPLLKPTPINVAEAIIEPFWDPDISGLPKWHIADGTAYGLQVSQTWASAQFQWASKPKQGPALKMSYEFGIDCSGYDRLLLAMTAPAGAVVRIAATTDQGERALTSPPSNQDAMEYELDLQGASRIEAITIEIEAGTDGAAAGWFKWIGLQNTSLLPRYFAQYDLSGIRWEAQLKDESFEPSFKPVYGIFMTEDELSAARAEHQCELAKGGNASPYTQRLIELPGIEPERAIHEFVNSSGRKNEPDARTRDADMDTYGIGDGVSAARLGLILKDKALLRLAARCALSLAASEKWDTGFEESFPGSSFELRSFRRGYCSEDVARIMDFAGEMFTESGRRYLLRRLAEEGIGPMNGIAWRFDYLYRSNQMTFFGFGRLCAYLVLEREWPRVKPYTDLARADLETLLDNMMMADGGFMEPPTYSIGTVNRAREMLQLYARARRQELMDVMPKKMKRTGNYAAVVASTLPGADVIPIGDSGKRLDAGSLIGLASFAPDSNWLTMLRWKLATKPENSLHNLQPDQRKMLEALPSKTPDWPAFVLLPQTGLCASTRQFRGQTIKVFVRGNRGDWFHDHEHEDTGNFVIEFAGQAFAMDPGIAEYDKPQHTLMKHCEWHNMLVPVVESERPHPVEKLQADVIPEAKGNKKSFHGRLDITPDWDAYYKKWVRSFDSPSPERLTIRDEYELVGSSSSSSVSGADFYWQTALPCTIQDGGVLIEGGRVGSSSRSTAKLTPDAGCSIRIDDLPDAGNRTHKRIAFRKLGAKGSIEVNVLFALE